MSPSIRSVLMPLLLLLAIAGGRAGACAAEAAGDGYVVWLHSYHPADWSDALLRGIRSTLGRDQPLRIEFMDAKRRSDEPYLAALGEVLRLKHAGRPVRAVIASDDDAARFAVAHRQDIFGGAPVAWCGINRFEPALLADGHATGVVEEIDAEATLDLAFRLRPNAQAIHLICDGTGTSIDNLVAIRSVLGRRHAERRVELVRDLPLAHLPAHLAALPADDVAFFIGYWRDGDGRPVEPGQLEAALRGSACPVLGRSEWMIGRGQLGGLCVSGEAHGRAAAALALRLIAGEAAASIPAATEANVWTFDARELARHGIAESALPAGAVVLHRPDSLLRQHPWQVAGTAAAIVVLAGLSTALGVAVLRRRRAERALAAERSTLAAVLDQSMQLMGILDTEGRLMLANQAALELAGVGLPAVVGRHFWATSWWTHDSAMVSWLRDAIAAVAAGGPPVRRLVTHRGASGTVRHIDFSLTAVRLPDGSRRLVPEGRDVTDLIATRDRLAESENRFRQLAEHIDAVFWLLERGGGRALYVSPGCRRIWGRPPVELVGGAGWLEAVHPEDRGSALQACSAGTGKAELRVQGVDGGVRRVSMRFYPVAGDGERVAAIADDVTELSRLEAEAREAQRLQLLRQLSGGVAHDFNNALAGILGNTELVLADPGLSDAARQRLRAVAATAARAGSVTRQLLAFARTDAPERCRFDLVQVISDAVTLARPAMRSGMHLHWTPPDRPFPVEGDPGLVQNAVLNLLLNARDAVQERDGGGSIGIVCAERGVAADDPLRPQWRLRPGAYAAVTVADDGCGIDPEVRGRIFEPFFTTKPAGSGSGLGLAAVHGTASDHGGAVAVESQPGVGSTFTLLLPMRIPETASAGGHTVLIVDDDAVVREVTAQLVESMGHRVRLATDGQEAVDQVVAGGVDLVVMDMVMPRLDGRAALRRIRSLAPRLPVLMLSGWSDAGAEALLLEGATAVLGKPLAVADLRREIGDAMRIASG